MTFEDDFIQLEFGEGVMRRAACVKNNIEWPPPQTLNIYGIMFERVSMSQITDEERSNMSHVCRGALYKIKESS